VEQLLLQLEIKLGKFCPDGLFSMAREGHPGRLYPKGHALVTHSRGKTMHFKLHTTYMSVRRSLVLFTMIYFLVPSGALAQIIVDFEDLAHTASNVGPTFNSYDANGFTFQGFSGGLGVGGDANALASMGSSAIGFYPGSAALINRFFVGTILLTRHGGSTFDLISVDVSEATDELANAFRTITFIGTKNDSSTVTFHFHRAGIDVNGIEGVGTQDSHRDNTFGSKVDRILITAWFNVDISTCDHQSNAGPIDCQHLRLPVINNQFDRTVNCYCVTID